ncbi:MAG: VWA domain-containing protein [Chloroflexota bacterium]
MTLSITTTLNQDFIPVDSSARLMYVLLRIQPREINGASTPLPVNIGIVVDNSDSMRIPILSSGQFEKLARAGAVSETMVDGVAVWQFQNVPSSYKLDAPRNLDFVKQALRSALERLAPRDQFSLAAFAGQAKLLVPLQSGKHKRALLDAIDTLDDLKLGNETLMATGMNLGYEQVKRGFSREMVNHMIVLTDGFTLDAPQCQFLAQQAAQSGISISTLGLGVEFNEELLIQIADASGGNAYFIHDPAEIPDAFKQELSGMQNVVLRDLMLKMRLMQGVELKRVHRVKPIIADLGVVPTQDRAFDLALGELGRGGEIALLLELLAPPKPAGQSQLAHYIVEYNQPSAGVFGEKARQNIVVQYTGDAANAPINPTVMNIVEKVSAFKLQTRALDDAARGDIAGATQKLKAAATRLINMGEDDLARAALNEAANLERRGQMTAEGAKRLRYDTRRLAQKLD